MGSSAFGRCLSIEEPWGLEPASPTARVAWIRQDTVNANGAEDAGDEARKTTPKKSLETDNRFPPKTSAGDERGDIQGSWRRGYAKTFAEVVRKAPDGYTRVTDEAKAVSMNPNFWFV
jgi:hypothetical protein